MCASGARAFSGTFLLNILHSFSSFSASVQHPFRALLCVFSVLLLCTVYAVHHMHVLCTPSMCTAATYMHAHRSCCMTIIAHDTQQSSTAHTDGTQLNFRTALVGNPSLVNDRWFTIHSLSGYTQPTPHTSQCQPPILFNISRAHHLTTSPAHDSIYT